MSAAVPSFGARLAAALDAHGRLCVGIDPHAGLLADWGLPDSADGVRDFGLRVVEATAGRAGIVKPQVAFFERHGAAGFAALEQVLAAARAAGLLVIADAKRADIGSTMDAYGAAWFTPGAPLEADALTLAPFAGIGALDPALERAAAAGKGVFLLAATSNPEGPELQTAVLGAGRYAGRTLAGAIAAEAGERNRDRPDGVRLGSVGVVIGATVDLGAAGLHPAELAATPILAPGFGFQGARLADADALFGPLATNVLASTSRAVLAAGPDGIADAVTAAAELAA